MPRSDIQPTDRISVVSILPDIAVRIGRVQGVWCGALGQLRSERFVTVAVGDRPTNAHQDATAPLAVETIEAARAPLPSRSQPAPYTRIVGVLCQSYVRYVPLLQNVLSVPHEVVGLCRGHLLPAHSVAIVGVGLYPVQAVGHTRQSVLVVPGVGRNPCPVRRRQQVAGGIVSIGDHSCACQHF